jgi:uncharacterized membrane protein YidH (DUF202 family)
MDDQRDNQPDDKPRDLSLLQVAGSILAAAFGVQSSKNRQRDFSRGKPRQFIILGIVFTTAFVLIVVAVVNIVLSNVG